MKRHFRDRRGADSLHNRNRFEIAIFMCKQIP